MARTGVDYAWSKPSIAAMTAAGITFACRYLSYDTGGKNLTAVEAATLRAAGIDVVSNWEWGADDARKGFACGVSHATEAARQHLACGGPADAPIFFSVDFDVADYAPGSADPRAKLGAVGEYLRGAASVIGPARVGVYGGYWLVRRALDAGLAAYGWQTYAWSGGAWDARAKLRQTRCDVAVGGASVDLNTALADSGFGEWGTRTTPAAAAAAEPTGEVDMASGQLEPGFAADENGGVFNRRLVAGGVVDAHRNTRLSLGSDLGTVRIRVAVHLDGRGWDVRSVDVDSNAGRKFVMDLPLGAVVSLARAKRSATDTADDVPAWWVIA